MTCEDFPHTWMFKQEWHGIGWATFLGTYVVGTLDATIIAIIPPGKPNSLLFHSIQFQGSAILTLPPAGGSEDSYY